MSVSRVLVLAVALCAPFVSAGCGEDDLVAGDWAPHAYDGPLVVSKADARHPSARAAGNVVDCTTWGDGGYSGSGVYAEGATADSPSAALETARSEGGFGGAQDGLLIAKQEDDRVLYVLEVEGQVKQAVIVRDGPATEGAGGPGWHVESWARCDYSELPRSFTDTIGLQIWSDADGTPVPTTTVESWVGPAHCDWQSMTFLMLGEDTYVRNPLPEHADYVVTPYQADTELPADAVDTGFQRDGKQLWLAADGRRAFVGTTAGVEAWPRESRPLGCD